MGQASRDRPKNLAAKLLAIREKIGASQSQLAKLLNFDKGAARICEYEHGVREPSLLTLLRYSKLARVSINVLVDDDLELKFPKRWRQPKPFR
jgi:transcriptional regulator with XRE-family HTH domain